MKRLACQQQAIKQIEYRQANRRFEYINKKQTHGIIYYLGIYDLLFTIYSYLVSSFRSISTPGNPVAL
jgi:hypothetical protein